MRIYLNLIVTLLVALLAMSGIVSAEDTMVTTEVQSAQEIDPPVSAAIIQGAVGAASLSAMTNLVVNSNIDWDLMAQGTNGGKMISETITTQAPMQVSADNGTNWVELAGTSGDIISAQGYGASINAPVIYSQIFGYADKAGIYSCTVTWTIGPVA